ncbi:hypothetical protein P283_N20281 [Saccharomyces cerevisiae P283]|uniref:Putative uncharacterized protein YNL067W-A n=1 Tax=Saccharomyces cerevisiae (strain ATCC 204508 / S288c) TaxID=559292 RepID=YN67A_YEAST|nr:RecName: Full=Putative uncharacterized protein YNL067W-A [Saccharomyces cerevisiae S288C]EWG83774.1 hypothetical protein R008_N11581 [Saccharomyces cerevisiae R008]EWH16189.1 hypothetical protein P283_N20281 [Saccharomyces cerevisiae P283]
MSLFCLPLEMRNHWHFFSLFTNLPRKSKWHRASEFFFPLLMSEIEDFR